MNRPKVFRDPIHQNIALDRDREPEKLTLELLDAAEVQRLRLVRQLGLANLVYHGVEHSRFVHSLGVTAVAKAMHEAAAPDSSGLLTDDTLMVVLASAVLHDVGHPPFSHAVEKQLGVNHESLSIEVVGGDTEVGRILRKYGGEDLVRRVADHIGGTSDEPTTQFISSQLDADRSDYILRDGYYAGIPNAQFDLARIVQLLHFDERGLWFDVRALTAIEGYFIARYHLYLQLYYHKTVRAAEAMLRALLQRAKKLAGEGQDLGNIGGSVKRLFSGEANAVAVKLTDADLWAAFHVWETSATDETLKSLSRRLCSRRLFKALEITMEDYVEVAKLLPAIQALATAKGLDHEYFMLVDTAKDTPYKIADVWADPGEARSVRLRKRDGTDSSLEAISGVVKQLQEEAYKKVRLCFPEEMRADVLKIIPAKLRA